MIKEQLLQLNFLRFNLILVLFLNSFLLSSQTDIKVVDENGEALIGVEVYSAGFEFTGTTDSMGMLSIVNIDSKQILTFKYLGYRTQSLSLDNIISNNSVLVLEEQNEIFDEIILIGRTDISENEIPYDLDYIKQADIRLTNPQTSADALAQHASIFVQKSQLGGGSPVVRGFEANRVLLVVDGVRLNNIIYRSGHLQNAITIDQAMLERTEVIYGPGSLTYGSDALGGVIHFRSKRPKLSYSKDEAKKIETNWYLRHSTANSEKSAHVDFNIGGTKFGSLSSITFSDYGDLQMGSNRTEDYPDFGKRFEYVQGENGEDRIVQNSDPDLQVGTAYRQLDLLQKFLFVPNDLTSIEANIQISTSSNIPRYDRLIEYQDGELNFAEWFYGPQNRLLASVKYRNSSQSKFWDNHISILSYQNIEEDRIDRKFNSSLRNNQNEDVQILAWTSDFTKNINDNNKLYYGIDANYNTLNSDAFVENIATGEISLDILSRYPNDQANMSSFGAYIQHKWQSSDSIFRSFLGARYNHSTLNIRFRENPLVDWPNSFLEGLSNNNNAFTWAAGLNIQATKQSLIRLLASSAFRAPNVDDLAKIRVKVDEINFPNVDLIPERSINFELGIKQIFKDFTINVTGFYTRLSNAIVPQNFMTPDGKDIYVSNGDSLTVIANVNAESAYIYGISSNLRWQVGKLDAGASINYTRGRAIRNNQEFPLSHIPPTYGKMFLSYKFDKLKLNYVYRFNGFKSIDDYGGTTDNPEFATSGGSLGWSTSNFYLEFGALKSLNISLGMENIFDIHYRPFASGLSAPGRNFILSVSGQF